MAEMRKRESGGTGRPVAESALEPIRPCMDLTFRGLFGPPDVPSLSCLTWPVPCPQRIWCKAGHGSTKPVFSFLTKSHPSTGEAPCSSMAQLGIFQVHVTFICCCYLVVQSCLTLCDPIDCSPTGSSVHGISQARILEWVAISSSRRSSQPRDQTSISCMAGRFFTTGPPEKPSPTSEHFKIYFSHDLLGSFLVPISEIPRQHILMKYSL